MSQITIKYCPRCRVEGRFNLVKDVWSIKADGFPRRFISSAERISNGLTRGFEGALSEYAHAAGIDAKEYIIVHL